MAIKMTRAEYEAKYGQPPVFTATSRKNFFDDALQDIKETGSALKNTAVSTFGKQKAALGASIEGEQSLTSGLSQAVGIGAGGLSRAVGDVVVGAGKAVLPQSAEEGIKTGVEKVATPIVQSKPVQDLISRYNSLDDKKKREVDALIGVGSLVADFAGGRAVKAGIETGINKAISLVDDISIRSPKLNSIPEFRNKALDFLSKEPDAKTTTILKETPTEKFDKYVDVGEQASVDPRKLTPYEVAGEEAQKALIALQKRMDGVGAQKSAIIKKARVGTIDMAKDVRDTLRAINKSFKGVQGADRALVEKVFTKLKSAKRLQDVDRVIDEAQALIYADAKNLTLSLGKATTKRLQGIIEELNSKVKTRVGGNYAKLNEKYSEYITQRNYLNKVLGEKVGDTAIRGGSLVKRFFSPSDAGTKQLFEFLKKELNIDLAQDVTTARFVMELFNDPRARALLEGIPTSPRGVIEKGVDVLVDKTGLGKKLQSTIRESELRKARTLTK